jgi:hypothetical protein
MLAEGRPFEKGLPTMMRSLPASVSQIFLDAEQPGFQGLLEVMSFVIVIAMIAGAYVAAAMLLFWAI